MSKHPIVPSYGRARAILMGAAAGIAIAIFGVGMDGVFDRLHVPVYVTKFDDILIGLVCGIAVSIYLERREYRMLKRLRMIADLNHIIRNELDVIFSSAYLTRDREHIERIEHCVNKVQWALREVLPGEEEEAPPPFPPRRAEPGEKHAHRAK